MNENEIIERVEHILGLSDGDEGFNCEEITRTTCSMTNGDERVVITLTRDFELKELVYGSGRIIFKVYQAPHVADLEYEDETDSNDGYPCLVDEDLAYEFLENNFL